MLRKGCLFFMSKFEESEWNQPKSSERFIEESDFYIPNRKQQFEVLKSFYTNNLLKPGNKQIKLMDFGCGDGRVTEELLKVDGDLSGVLVDGSKEMINNAKKRLRSYTNIKFHIITFQELIENDLINLKFDLIISSLAIHHLSRKDKQSLFHFIYSHLNRDGFFLNMDVIKAPTEFLEEWYLTLWREWIQENETKSKNTGRFTNIPDRYKNNPDNHPDRLQDQLNALESVGFRGVDCYYKYGIFSIYGGQK